MSRAQTHFCTKRRRAGKFTGEMRIVNSRSGQRLQEVQSQPSVAKVGAGEARRGIATGAGGEGGIPSMHPKKFSVTMVKLKSFVVNEQILEKSFCQ